MAVAEEPVYVYGVVRPDTSASSAAGVLGTSVEVVREGDLGALVSRVGDDRVRAKRRDLLAHSDVLQDAFGRGVVLPLRFGTLFRDEHHVRDELLGQRREELVELLGQYDGLGEMRLRASYHDEAHLLTQVVATDPAIGRLREETRGAGPGDARLLRLGELVAARVADQRRSDEDAILGRLGEGAVDVRRDEPDGELVVTKASFLIKRDRQARFDELLESVALSGRHLITFNCTGPMPPHSFVALDGG